MVYFPRKKCYHASKLCCLLILVVTVLSLFERYRGGKTSTSATTELEVELERQIVEDEARIIPSLGEGGVPAQLDGEGKRLGEESEKQFAINVYLSDRIPYNRTLKDFRNPSCKRVVYDAELPSASVIIIFHNEPYSVVIRTLWSVINSVRRDNVWFRTANYVDKKTGKSMNLGYKGQDSDSPFLYLKEIILVDDNSTLPELKDKLSHYVRTRLPPDLIRILRLPDRKGIAHARHSGAKFATAEVLVFLDSHCEVLPDWLRPILQRIKESPNSTITPLIDVINTSNLAYKGPSHTVHKSDKIGDVTHRKVLREKLKCKSFAWYLDNIYKEKFVPVRDVDAFGRFMNPLTGLCLDTLQRESEPAPLGVYPCHSMLQPTQYLSLSLTSQLRDEERCAHVHSHGRRDSPDLDEEGRPVMMMSCRPHQRGQKWRYIPSTQQIQNLESRLCLESPHEAGADVVAKTCSDSKREQRWHIDYTENTFENNNVDPAISSQEVKLQKLRGQRRISRSLLSHSENDTAATRRRKNKKNKFVLKLLRSINGTEQHLEADIHCKHRTLYPNDTFVRDIVTILNEKDIKVINNGRVFEKNRVYEVARKKKKNSRARSKFNEIIVRGHSCTVCPNEMGKKYVCCKSNDKMDPELVIVNVDNVKANVDSELLDENGVEVLRDASENEGSSEQWLALSIDVDDAPTVRRFGIEPIEVLSVSQSSFAIDPQDQSPKNTLTDGVIVKQTIKPTTDNFNSKYQNLLVTKDDLIPLTAKPSYAVDDYFHIMERLAVNKKNLEDAEINADTGTNNFGYNKLQSVMLDDVNVDKIISGKINNKIKNSTPDRNEKKYENERNNPNLEERWLSQNVRAVGGELKNLKPLLKAERLVTNNVVPVGRDFSELNAKVISDYIQNVDSHFYMRKKDGHTKNTKYNSDFESTNQSNDIFYHTSPEFRLTSQNFKSMGGERRSNKPVLTTKQKGRMSKNLEAADRNPTNEQNLENFYENYQKSNIDKSFSQNIKTLNENMLNINSVARNPSVDTKSDNQLLTLQYWISKNVKPKGRDFNYIKSLLEALEEQLLLQKALKANGLSGDLFIDSIKSHLRNLKTSNDDPLKITNLLQKSVSDSNNIISKNIELSNLESAREKKYQEILQQWISRHINQDQYLQKYVAPTGCDIKLHAYQNIADKTENVHHIHYTPKETHKPVLNDKGIDDIRKASAPVEILPVGVNPLNILFGPSFHLLPNNISYVLLPTSNLAWNPSPYRDKILPSKNIELVDDNSRYLPYNNEVLVSRELMHKKRAVDSKDVSHSEGSRERKSRPAESTSSKPNELFQRKREKSVKVKRDKYTHFYRNPDGIDRESSRKVVSLETWEDPELKSKLNALKQYWEKTMHFDTHVNRYESDSHKIVDLYDSQLTDDNYSHRHNDRYKNADYQKQRKHFRDVSHSLEKDYHRKVVSSHESSNVFRTKNNNIAHTDRNRQKYISVQLREMAPNEVKNSREVSKKYRVVEVQDTPRKIKSVNRQSKESTYPQKIKTQSFYKIPFIHREKSTHSNENINRHLMEEDQNIQNDDEQRLNLEEKLLGSNERRLRNHLTKISSESSHEKLDKHTRTSQKHYAKSLDRKQMAGSKKLSKSQIREVLRRFRNIKPEDREKLKTMKIRFNKFIRPVDLIDMSPKENIADEEILHSHTPKHSKVEDERDIIFMDGDSWGFKLVASPEHSKEDKHRNEPLDIDKNKIKLKRLPINKLLGTFETVQHTSPKNLQEMEEKVVKHIHSHHMKHKDTDKNLKHVSKKIPHSHEYSLEMQNAKKYDDSRESRPTGIPTDSREYSSSTSYPSFSHEIPHIYKPIDSKEQLNKNLDTRFTVVHKNANVIDSSDVDRNINIKSGEVFTFPDSHEALKEKPLDTYKVSQKYKIDLKNKPVGYINNKLYDSQEMSTVPKNEGTTEKIKTSSNAYMPVNNKYYESIEKDNYLKDSQEETKGDKMEEKKDNVAINKYSEEVNKRLEPYKQGSAEISKTKTENKNVDKNYYNSDDSTIVSIKSKPSDPKEKTQQEFVLSGKFYDSYEKHKILNSIETSHNNPLKRDEADSVEIYDRIKKTKIKKPHNYTPIGDVIHEDKREFNNKLADSRELLKNQNYDTNKTNSFEIHDQGPDKSPERNAAVDSREKSHNYLTVDLEKVSGKVENSKEVIHKYKIVNLRDKPTSTREKNSRETGRTTRPNSLENRDRPSNKKGSREIAHTPAFDKSRENNKNSQELATSENYKLIDYFDFL